MSETRRRTFDQMGLGPMSHPDINARVQEADQSKRYMIAIWSVVDAPEAEVAEDGTKPQTVNFSMLTNKFPSMDLPKAGEQFNDSLNDFQLQIIKAAADSNVVEGEKLTEEQMASRPSGVVTKKTPLPTIPQQEVPPPVDEGK